MGKIQWRRRIRLQGLASFGRPGGRNIRGRSDGWQANVGSGKPRAGCGRNGWRRKKRAARRERGSNWFQADDAVNSLSGPQSRKSSVLICSINFPRGGEVANRRAAVVDRVAARLGLEPRQNESESFVLPLHHRAEKPFILHVRVLAGSRDPAAPEDAARSKSETGGWSRRWDSNPQPPVYKTGALPLSYAGRTCRHRGRKFEFKQHQARATLRRPAGVGPVDAGWWLPGDSNPEPTD